MSESFAAACEAMVERWKGRADGLRDRLYREANQEKADLMMAEADTLEDCIEMMQGELEKHRQEKATPSPLRSPAVP